MARSKKYSDAQLRKAVESSTSFAGVVRFLGAGASGSSHQWIKRRVLNLGLDYSHFTHRGDTAPTSPNRRTPEDILVHNPKATKRTARTHLLFALLSKNREYVCEMPGCPSPQPMWRGQALPLEIDHIDGDWRNNLLENLRFLCPNCHHQTETNRRGQAISVSSVDELLAAKNALYKTTCPQCQHPMSKRSQLCYSCHTKSWDPTPKTFICPNCGGRKDGRAKACRDCTNRTLGRTPTKVTYPPVDELVSRISQSSVLRVSKELGVSDVALRKYLRNRGVDTKSIKKSKR